VLGLGLLEPLDEVLGQRSDHGHVAAALSLSRVAELIRGEHAIDLNRAAGARQIEDVLPADRQCFLGAEAGAVDEPSEHTIPL